MAHYLRVASCDVWIIVALVTSSYLSLLLFRIDFSCPPPVPSVPDQQRNGGRRRQAAAGENMRLRLRFVSLGSRGHS